MVEGHSCSSRYSETETEAKRQKEISSKNNGSFTIVDSDIAEYRGIFSRCRKDQKHREFCAWPQTLAVHIPLQ